MEKRIQKLINKRRWTNPIVLKDHKHGNTDPKVN